MGAAAADGGKGFKERARVSGEAPMGAARCRQQSTQASCKPPPLLSTRAGPQQRCPVTPAVPPDEHLVEHPPPRTDHGNHVQQPIS